MPCVHIKFGRGNHAILTVPGEYKPGDQAPEGYLEWHAWAEVQHKTGLRQEECGVCGLWRYPQELSDEVRAFEAQDKFGNKLTIRYRVCNNCATPRPEGKEGG